MRTIRRRACEVAGRPPSNHEVKASGPYDAENARVDRANACGACKVGTRFRCQSPHTFGVAQKNRGRQIRSRKAKSKAKLGHYLLFIVGGTGFIAKNFLVVATPEYDVPYALLSMFLAMVSWTLWVFIKGVDGARWEAVQAAQATVGR